MNTAGELYQEKLERLEKAARLEVPDRVPIAINTVYFPARYAGTTYHDMFYEPGKFTASAAKFAEDFDWDGAGFLRAFDSVTLGAALAAYDPSVAISVATASVWGGAFPHTILRDNYTSYPGEELPEDVEYQWYMKEPFMNADEYDDFLANPFGFLAGTVVPRAYESLGSPGSPEATGALIKLGIELGKLPSILSDFTTKMKEAACPPWYFALAPNPLDYLGAFLRDFDDLLLDIHRKPEKVKAICDALTPVLAAVGKATGQISLEMTGSRRVFMPTWYNTYLSPEKYREFHWPYIKRMVAELVDADFTPLLCYQGKHDHLLETILELPEKKVINWFEVVDLKRAKEVIGDHSCIAAGISPSLLIGGTPDKVEEAVREIMDALKPGGGFIFTLPFNCLGDAKVENVRAMTDAVMEYGEY